VFFVHHAGPCGSLCRNSRRWDVTALKAGFPCVGIYELLVHTQYIDEQGEHQGPKNNPEKSEIGKAPHDAEKNEQRVDVGVTFQQLRPQQIVGKTDYQNPP
jgi:hypothetical protein